MAKERTDDTVLEHIRRLAAEEERLYAEGSPSDEDRERLGRINVELDRCWDLLRQRRALRDAGRSPDEAEPRSADTVENYRDS